MKRFICLTLIVLALACRTSYGQPYIPEQRDLFGVWAREITPEQLAFMRWQFSVNYLFSLQRETEKQQMALLRQLAELERLRREQLMRLVKRLQDQRRCFQGRWEMITEKDKPSAAKPAAFVLDGSGAARQEGTPGVLGVWSIVGDGSLAHVMWKDDCQFVLHRFADPFAGSWQIVDAKGKTVSTLTLTGSHTAKKSHVPNATGKWEVVSSEARITWSDGWRDILRPQSDGVQKIAFRPGTSWKDKPTNTERAVRESIESVERERGEKFAFAKGVRLKDKPSAKEKIVHTDGQAVLVLSGEESVQIKALVESIKKKARKEREAHRLLLQARQLANRSSSEVDFTKDVRKRYEQIARDYRGTQAADTVKKLLDKMKK